jgi:UDP-hydrolysing UDP-N-acetyl-D-glucosamine 2-epimerase
MDLNELNEYTGLNFNNNIALVTYHPVTLDDYNSSSVQTKEILSALLETELITLITMPNADVGGLKVYDEIMKYVDQYPGKFKLIKNMGQVAYLSAMNYSKLMIGNSSSGIIESASFKLPVVNIGDRQGGRVKPGNVIDCKCSKEEILHSITKALSAGFIESISKTENPYGDGNTADRIMEILKLVNFRDRSELLKKKFFDI